ncbi:hypothetical protein Syun_011763 [Stephania yunnanensis]|uniref:Uncharacterized protein n=1 Tax=Stephania yunnanensis TaxID=152371 RepID=A0AAP0JY52_9MAGN
MIRLHTPNERTFMSDSEESNETAREMEGGQLIQMEINEWEDDRVLETPNLSLPARDEERLKAIIETEIVSITALMAQRELLGVSPLGFETCPLYIVQPEQELYSQSSEELSVLRIFYDPGGPDAPQEVHLGSISTDSLSSQELLTQC